MRKLLIASAARRDLAEIAAYTKATWGDEQRRSYLGAIRQNVAAIRDQPSIGHQRDELRKGYGSLASGRHQIFYRESGSAIIVIRILHGNQDVHRHLPPAED